MTIIRTDANNTDFVGLVTLLDIELAERDGKDHLFYDQFNRLTLLKNVVVAYKNDTPVGCGAMKEATPYAMEVKRMYVLPNYRGKKIAGRILLELESWAFQLGYQKCVLETGKRQPEAIRLYENEGYARIPNYGPYVGIENSVCFEKNLRKLGQ